MEQGFQMVKLVLDPQPKKARKKRKIFIKKPGNDPSLMEVGKPATKVERKAHRDEQKRLVKAHSSSDDSHEEEIVEDQVDVPSAFKRYTIQDRTILLQKPK